MITMCVYADGKCMESLNFHDQKTITAKVSIINNSARESVNVVLNLYIGGK